MAHDGQDLQVPPVIVVDGGDANSGINTAESPAAGNGSNGGGEHLVDAEEFKNMRMAIGTLGKSILEISLSDNLTGTRHIDIRVRQNNRPQSGGGVATGPDNEAPPQEQAPPPDSAAAAQSRSRRLKITVAADETEPKPDADAQFLDQMRGWLMTVAALFVGVAFQAATQPPQWVLAQQEAARLEREHGSNTWPAASGPAAAPSPDAANQRATKHWWSPSKDDRATLYHASNGAAFVVAMSLLLVLLLVRGTSTASRVTRTVKYEMPALFLAVGFTFVMAMSTNWLMTGALFFSLVPLAAVLTAGLLGKLRGCNVWLRSKLICR